MREGSSTAQWYVAYNAGVALMSPVWHPALPAPCCPIHRGTNPRTFVVSTAKNAWRCFGDCNRGGNVIELVAALENLSPTEAARLLAERLGIDAVRPASSLNHGGSTRRATCPVTRSSSSKAKAKARTRSGRGSDRRGSTRMAGVQCHSFRLPRERPPRPA